MEISLREITADDWPTLEAWATSDDLAAYMSRRAPRSAAGRGEASALTHWHIIVVDGKNVGSVWLERPAISSVSVDLGIFLAEPDLRGQGIGHRAIELAVSHTAARWTLERVRLNVREGNARAIACYRKAGFVVVGRGEKQAARATIAFLSMERIVGRRTAEQSE